MRLAYISDLHYPWEITRQTFLASDHGYRRSFYEIVDGHISSLKYGDVDALVINGDLSWDFRFLTRMPFVPPDWDVYNMVVYQLQSLRHKVDARVPIILAEGNHDSWFDRYVHSIDGDCYLDVGDYIEFLCSVYRLSRSQADKVLMALGAAGQDHVDIGENMYLLSNEGKIVGDGFIYCLGYYNKKKLTVPWAEYKKALLQMYADAVDSLVYGRHKGELSLPLKTVIFQHVHPPAMKWLSDFQIEHVDVKALVWGHWHGPSLGFLRGLSSNGPYKSSLPRMDGNGLFFLTA